MRPPSVDRLARSLAHTGLPHPLLVDVARAAIADGEHEQAETRARAVAASLLQPVINATGTMLHTNLGRAPWSYTAEASFSNLEFDLSTGQRGSRQRHVGRLFAQLCDAEAAIIVNNCAAAVTLAMAGLAVGREVAVSRGELVEIGGGFRVPDVIEQSGAALHAVGTTNRTRASDFANAAESGADIAVNLMVHQSNYKIVGFTEAPTVTQLAELDTPLVCDIGSGLLDAACPWLASGPPPWLEDEPAAKQTLAAGADLVCFSGDKLLGGPQAGIIAGRADLVAKCAAHPLARAFRPGGLVLSSLQELAMAYLRRDGDAIPFWRMAARTPTELRERATALGIGQVVDLMSVPGGGTLPTVEVPSVGVMLTGDHTQALRVHQPPIIARVQDQKTLIDLRTVEPGHDSHIAAALRALNT
ncbi:MAG: L-seryl-tRNA(Sec) selenium transferase [Acidimicrobiales bacterium]